MRNFILALTIGTASVLSLGCSSSKLSGSGKARATDDSTKAEGGDGSDPGQEEPPEDEQLDGGSEGSNDPSGASGTLGENSEDAETAENLVVEQGSLRRKCDASWFKSNGGKALPTPGGLTSKDRLIHRAFVRLMDRLPTPPELASLSGIPEQEVPRRILDTWVAGGDYRGKFVDLYFCSIFGREPTAKGREAWVDHWKNSGVGPGGEINPEGFGGFIYVFASFFDAANPEVTERYETLRGGATSLSRDETLVSFMFLSLLERLPAPAGLSHWSHELTKPAAGPWGRSPEVALSLIVNEEFMAIFVDRMFHILLDRDATADAKKYYAAAMAEHPKTMDSLIYDIVASDEFRGGK